MGGGGRHAHAGQVTGGAGVAVNSDTVSVFREGSVHVKKTRDRRFVMENYHGAAHVYELGTVQGVSLRRGLTIYQTKRRNNLTAK